MKLRRWKHGWLALALWAGTACTTENVEPRTASEYESRAKLAYDAALVEFLDQNWEYAAQLMQDVQRNYAYTPYARMAELRLADIAFRQEKYPEAIAAYKAYAHDHPNDAQVPYARYRVIRSQFLTSSNTVFQPPLEERDLAAVRDAYSAIRAFLADYPNYDEQDELAFMYESVSGMLARHELYVARFYANEDRFDAAIRRVQYAVRTYQRTGMEAEAVVLLGEIYLKKEQPKKAAAMFRHVLEKYPDSAFTIPAKHFLEHIATLPGGAETAAPTPPDDPAPSPTQVPGGLTQLEHD